MNENCASDSESTLVEFLIVCCVLQHQFTNQCTFIRVAVVAGAGAAVIITSSSSITGIPDSCNSA